MSEEHLDDFNDMFFDEIKEYVFQQSEQQMIGSRY